MKIAQTKKSLLITVACLTAISGTLAMAQTTSRLLSDSLGQNSPEPEKPVTTRERLETALALFAQRQEALVTLFNGMVTQPDLLSSKESVANIEAADRNFKKSKASFDFVRNSLSADLKKIKADTYFTDEQKTELIEKIDAMAKQCEDSAAQVDSTLKVLSKSYKLMPEWRKGYRAYLNLEDETKATQHLKAAVDEFVKQLTAKPEEKVEITETEDSDKPEN